MVKFEEILEEFHTTKNKTRKSELIIEIASHFYLENEIEKAELLLQDCTETTLKNYHHLKALIALYHENYSLAKEHLEKELEHHPENEKSKILYQKLKEHTQIPIINYSIIIISILLSSYYFYTESYSTLLSYGLYSNTILIQTILSSIFLHMHPIHLIINCIGLYLIGKPVEKKIGSLYYLVLFLTSASIGNYIQAISSTTPTFIVGASAGIFGIFGMLIMRSPKLEIKILGIFSMPLILIFGIVFALSLFLPTSLTSSAEIAHITGLFIGMLYGGLLYPETIKSFYHWIFISFGFALLVYGLKAIVFSKQFLSGIPTILLGSILIYYGYEKLEYSEKKEVITNE
jgi:membrane associated rhomboid family serine protease